MVPDVATSTPAISAASLPASRRAIAQAAIVAATPAIIGVTRGPLSVRSPIRSPTYKSGKCNGPCAENTPVYGARP